MLPEVNVGLHGVKEENQLLMQLCVYLGADIIPVELLFSLLGHNDHERLSDAVEELEALSLVQLEY